MSIPSSSVGPNAASSCNVRGGFAAEVEWAVWEAPGFVWEFLRRKPAVATRLTMTTVTVTAKRRKRSLPFGVFDPRPRSFGRSRFTFPSLPPKEYFARQFCSKRFCFLQIGLMDCFSYGTPYPDCESGFCCRRLSDDVARASAGQPPSKCRASARRRTGNCRAVVRHRAGRVRDTSRYGAQSNADGNPPLFASRVALRFPRMGVRTFAASL